MIGLFVNLTCAWLFHASLVQAWAQDTVCGFLFIYLHLLPVSVWVSNRFSSFLSPVTNKQKHGSRSINASLTLTAPWWDVFRESDYLAQLTNESKLLQNFSLWHICDILTNDCSYLPVYGIPNIIHCSNALSNSFKSKMH